MKKRKITIYDVTLREGMQSPGASFTVADKIRITKLLDDAGADFIEGGNPFSNPKDVEFFERVRKMNLKHAKMCAFGSTCKIDTRAEEDPGLICLREVRTKYVCIYGKSSLFHVKEVLKTEADKNLTAIYDSVRFLKDSGKYVFFDAEHFFDGVLYNDEYAFSCIETAINAGADTIVLCDTNGGTMPFDMVKILKKTLKKFPDAKFGIHAHNDGGCADANTLECIRCGAECAQLSLHGYGERCGNADFYTVVPDLQLKMGMDCIPDLSVLFNSAFASADILNIKNNPKAPYVGRDAFRHKAGTHIDGVIKNPASFEHIDPAIVGSSRRFIVSEMSGKAAVTAKIKRNIPGFEPSAEEAERVCRELKNLELKGYQFENADASFEMMVRRTLGLFKPHFALNNYKVVAFSGEASHRETASAVVDMNVNGNAEISAGKGIGPVDALDGALRRALGTYYPEISKMHLNDYRVHVLDTKEATASSVRVLIESTDGTNTWNTVGVSGDVIEASWLALVDAHEYFLHNL